MSDIAKELDDVLKSRQTNGYHIRRIAGQARDEIERLREALGALGVVGNGYCFCSHDRDPDKAGHQPECRDALAARLADAVAALREIAHAHDTDARGLRFMAADALIAHNAIVSATPNQCDGCARGLPLVDGIHRGEGYDLIGCTADRYTDSAPAVRTLGAVEGDRLYNWRFRNGDVCGYYTEAQIRELGQRDGYTDEQIERMLKPTTSAPEHHPLCYADACHADCTSRSADVKHDCPSCGCDAPKAMPE